MNEKIDFIKQGFERLITQYKESENLKNYIKVYLEELQIVENTIFNLKEQLDIDSARGKLLDVYGILVGQPREIIDSEIFKYFGFSNESSGFGNIEGTVEGGIFLSVGQSPFGYREMGDAEYRVFIKAKITRNHTKCTPEEIIEALSFLFNAPHISLREGDAAIYISIGKILTRTEKNLIKNNLILPKTLGVDLNLVGEYDYNNYFAFSGAPNGKGFGNLENSITGGKFASLI